MVSKKKTTNAQGQKKKGGKKKINKKTNKPKKKGEKSIRKQFKSQTPFLDLPLN